MEQEQCRIGFCRESIEFFVGPVFGFDNGCVRRYVISEIFVRGSVKELVGDEHGNKTIATCALKGFFYEKRTDIGRLGFGVGFGYGCFVERS